MWPSSKGKAGQAGFPLCADCELQLRRQEQEIAGDLGAVIK